MRRTSIVALLTTTCALTPVVLGLTGTADAATQSSITGTAFTDSNRNGVLDTGETPRSGDVLYLFASDGSYVKNATTDSAGNYSFSGLSDGDYTVSYSSTTYSGLEHDWTPTTTGSLQPTVHVHLSGSAQASFGWRPIVWSTSLSSPVSQTTTANGTTVQSFNDAVTATQVAALLGTGALLGDEGSSATVRVGYGDVDQTVTSSTSSNGAYSGFVANSYISWDSWLSNADANLFHEYGHAWSLYFATIVQQDPSLAGYLQARGLTGDSRLGSSYAWNVKELVAEDYRQLFGNAAAAAQPQANTDIPPAASVPGLKDYLQTTFRTPSPSTSTTQTPPPPPAPAINGLAMNPTTVSKSGTASFTLNTASTVTLTVRTSAGSVVATLLSSSSQPAGTVKATWNRTTSSGTRAKSGAYVLTATATNGSGSTQASASFSVS